MDAFFRRDDGSEPHFILTLTEDSEFNCDHLVSVDNEGLLAANDAHARLRALGTDTFDV
jgi:hypothetical protein